jgi:hypothetical protein
MKKPIYGAAVLVIIALPLNAFSITDVIIVGSMLVALAVMVKLFTLKKLTGAMPKYISTLAIIFNVIIICAIASVYHTESKKASGMEMMGTIEISEVE